MPTVNTKETQRGASLLAAIFLIVVVGFFGLIVVSLVSTQNIGSLNEIQSTQAFYVAEAGLERAISYLLGPTLAPRTTCAGLPGAATSLNPGQFQLNIEAGSPFYSAAATTIPAGGITSGQTTIPVVSTVNYAPFGRIMIDRELIDYTGTTANSFTGALRGRDGTLAASHLAATRVGHSQCTVTSTGGVTDLTTAARGRRVERAGIQIQEGWAVGDSPNPGNAVGGQATVLRWNGTAWTDVSGALPARANQHLMGISMLSYADGWAVGNTGGGGAAPCTTNRARIINWNGTAWSCNSTSPSNQNLNSVAMISATDGWAVGAGGSTLQWDGATWTERNGAQAYTARELHSVWALATNEVWMTGRDENQNGKRCGNGTALILRYTGALPPTCQNANAPARRFRSIFMLDGPDVGAGADDGWIVGDRNGGDFTIYRWDPVANQWNNQSITNGWRERLRSVYMLDTDGDGFGDDGWAVGDVRTNGGSTRVTILRWNHLCAGGAAPGAWDICSFDPGSAASRQNLNAVSCATANDCWAVGDAGLLLHWDGAAWGVFSAGVITTRNLRSIHIIGPRGRPQAVWREVVS